MSKKREYKNKIVDYYRDHPIRQYNLIMIRVDEPTYKKFIDAKLDFHLSHKDAIIQQKVNIK